MKNAENALQKCLKTFAKFSHTTEQKVVLLKMLDRTIEVCSICDLYLLFSLLLFLSCDVVCCERLLKPDPGDRWLVTGGW
jgi:hypothetical protein